MWTDLHSYVTSFCDFVTFVFAFRRQDLVGTPTFHSVEKSA